MIASLQKLSHVIFFLFGCFFPLSWRIDFILFSFIDLKQNAKYGKVSLTWPLYVVFLPINPVFVNFSGDFHHYNFYDFLSSFMPWT